MVELGDIRQKLESYCFRHSEYELAFDETTSEFVITKAGEIGSNKVIKIENGKVRCSDPSFLEEVLNFIDDNGGYVPAVLDDITKKDAETLMKSLPSKLGELRAETVMQSMCPGGTPQEFINFLMFCKENEINPFRSGEAYWVKREDGSVSHVVGAQALVRKAQENPDFIKMDCGVIVMPKKEGAEPIYRKGEFYMASREDLVGGWCHVWLKSRGEDDPIVAEISRAEYDTMRSTWKQKPATMCVKVAKAHACRLASPRNTGGLYVAEELGIDPKKEI